MLVCRCKQAEAIWPPYGGKRTALQLISFCPTTKLNCCAFRSIGACIIRVLDEMPLSTARRRHSKRRTGARTFCVSARRRCFRPSSILALERSERARKALPIHYRMGMPGRPNVGRTGFRHRAAIAARAYGYRFRKRRFAGITDRYAGMMREESRSEAVTRRVRENKRRTHRSEFLAGLSRAVGSTIRPEQLLDLASTDEVHADLKSGYAAAVSGVAPRLLFSRQHSLAALEIPGLLAQPLADEPVLLWLKQSDVCGAAILTAGQVLRACEAIRVFDGDAVSMLSEDGTQGFIFDKDVDDDIDTFEVALWGSRWLEAATTCGIIR